MTSNDRALDDACGKLGELLKPAYISTLSPDVSGLVERLLVDAEYCADRVNPSIRLISCDLTEAADALASLSLQLAAVEGERDNWHWELGKEAEKTSIQAARAKAAEASLFAAQEENERLRKALEPFARCVKRDDPTCGDEEHFRHMFTYGALRRASNALRPPSKAKGEKK